MRITASARKHGISDSDIAAAVVGSRLVIALDDEAPQRQLVIGFDTTARLLEIVVLVADHEQAPIVIHAMAARREYRDLLRERS